MASTRSVEPEFRFNSGRLCLRRRASSPKDVLSSPGAGGRWLKAAGLLSEGPVLSSEGEARLVELREAIWALVSGSMSGAYQATATAVVNAAARYPLGTPQLDPSSGSVSVVSDDPIATALSIIARDAIDLVSGTLRHRVKACDQPDCRMLFVDTSPTGQR